MKFFWLNGTGVITIAAAFLVCTPQPGKAKDIVRIEVSFVETKTLKFRGSGFDDMVTRCSISHRLTFRGEKIFLETLAADCGGQPSSSQVGQGIIFPINGKSTEEVSCRQARGTSVSRCDNGWVFDQPTGSNATVQGSSQSKYFYESRLTNRSLTLQWTSVMSYQSIKRDGSQYSDSNVKSGRRWEIGLSRNGCQLKSYKDLFPFNWTNGKERVRISNQTCAIQYK